VGVLALGFITRLPLIWSAPLDTPSGPQATMAAFVRRLAQDGGDIKGAVPWVGPLPIDLTGGLPVYAWLAAIASAIVGPQPWVGRVLSLVAALVATGLLFVVMRRLAGGRAALYAALFLTIAPPGLYYGRAYLPDALGWATACAALAAALRWQDGGLAGRADEQRWFGIAAGTAALALLVAPANLAVLPPLLYIAGARRRFNGGPTPARARADMTLAYAALALAPLVIWWGLTRIGGVTSEIDPAFGGGGLSAALAGFGHPEFYRTLADRLLNGAVTFAGFLLLLAGVGRPARLPWPWIFHLWALCGLLVVLLNGSRLAADDSTLAAWLPALAALAGLGANWLATLPAGIVAALRGQDDEAPELDADVADGEPTPDPAAPARPDGRPQRGAVRRPGALPGDPARRARPWADTRAVLLRLGNVIAIGLMLGVFAGGWDALRQRFEIGTATARFADAGARVPISAPEAAGARMVVAGPGAPEMFYASGLTGWAVPEGDFTRRRLDDLKAAGADLLVTADQGWLGKHPDYPGLRVSFQPHLYGEPAPGFVVFDLRHVPPATDSSYFLETGHTLRGSFREFWQQHGGVAVLGFPISEEMTEQSPEDGQTRTVQYFERALLEYHPDKAGTSFDVQLAPLGRWLVQAKLKQDDSHGIPHIFTMDRAPAQPNTPTYQYFPQTGHGIKGQFLKAWQAAGGVRILGYPITQEFQDVLPADGKVHILQYFERARLEWHEEIPGPLEQKVKLGLIGREWLDQRP
jgi:hypothetical protein